MPTNEERYFNSSRKKYDDPTWVWQKDEHAGKFSVDNPYLNNLNEAIQHSDVDALYELAVKEEAKLADYRRERADKYADLQEQRAYDDPMAQVARERRAGINPDIAGAAGGGSVGSGSSATAQMPSLQTSTENTSRFGNEVDKHSMISGAVNSVSSLLGAFSSLGTAVTGSISTLSMLPIAKRAGELSNRLADELRPHQVALAEKQVALADKQVALVDKQVSGAQIAIDTADLDLINKSLGTLHSLSGFITPETSDEDATSILSSLGFDSSKIPSLLTGVKQWHSNPQYKIAWQNSIADSAQAEQRAKSFTTEFYSQLFDLAKQSEILQYSLNNSLQDFELKVANALNTDDYANLVADSTILGTSTDINKFHLTNEQIGFIRKQLEQDVKAFTNQLDFVKSAILTSKNTQYLIRERSIKNNRDLSPYEESLIEAESYRQKILLALGSQTLGDAKNIAYQSIQTRWYNQFGLKAFNGGLQLFNPQDRHYDFFMNAMNFTNYVNDEVTTDEISNGFVDFMIEGVKMIR